MPLTADGFQLVHPAVVRVQEIRPIRENLCVSRPNRALCPSSRLEAPAILRRFGYHIDSELYLVFDACCLRGDQPSATFHFFCHS
jgi:hypothetical protein